MAGVLELVRPADGVLGEEGTQRASESGKTWVIDPVMVPIILRPAVTIFVRRWRWCRVHRRIPPRCISVRCTGRPWDTRGLAGRTFLRLKTANP